MSDKEEKPTSDKKELEKISPNNDLLSEIQNIAPKINEQKALRLIQVVTTKFSGPIPPPSILKEYDDIVPGSAKKIMDSAHKQTNHRIIQEEKIVSSEISSSRIGQWMGFVIAIIILGLAAGFVYLGKDIWAFSIILSEAVGLVYIFHRKKN